MELFTRFAYFDLLGCKLLRALMPTSTDLTLTEGVNLAMPAIVVFFLSHLTEFC